MAFATCPKCGSKRVTLLSSQRTRYCHDGCGKQPWDLDPGQQPLIGSNRTIAKKKQTN